MAAPSSTAQPWEDEVTNSARVYWISSLVLLGLLQTSVGRAINTGDIIVADRRESGLIFVDHSTGAQHTLSPSLLSGQGFIDVTTNVNGDVYAIAAASGGVYKINTVDGSHTLVSSGGNLSFPLTVDWAPDGNLYVTEPDLSGGLIRVDPASGTQTVVVSGLVQGFAAGAANVGYIALADPGPAFHIYSVDLGTGQKVKISNTAVATPAGLAVDGSGNVILVDGGSVLRVDTSSGVFATVTTGGPMLSPWGVTLESNGTIVVTDHQKLNSCNPAPPAPVTCPGALYRVDPANGAQTLVTEKDLFHDIAGTDLYRGPNVATPTVRKSWGSVKAMYR